MAATMFFARPGQEHGPCVNKKCGHDVCADIRSAAESECPRCHVAIGYRTSFCEDPNPKRPGSLVHVRCLRAEEQWRSRSFVSL